MTRATRIGRAALLSAVVAGAVVALLRYHGRVPPVIANSRIAEPLVELYNSMRRRTYFQIDGRCLRRLRKSGRRFQVVFDAKRGDACPLRNVVKIFPDRLTTRPLYMTCRLALAVQDFEQHVLQPAALRHFGQPVVLMKDFGVRNCRPVEGYRSLLSEHAFANAIDVSGFVLQDQTTIEVARDWTGDGPHSAFLHELAVRACPIFTTVLAPGFNDRHGDHIHFDTGLLGGCRPGGPIPDRAPTAGTPPG